MSKLQPYGDGTWKRCTNKGCGRTGPDIENHTCRQTSTTYDHRPDMRRVFDDWKKTGQLEFNKEQEQFHG